MIQNDQSKQKSDQIQTILQNTIDGVIVYKKVYKKAELILPKDMS